MYLECFANREVGKHPDWEPGSCSITILIELKGLKISLRGHNNKNN